MCLKCVNWNKNVLHRLKLVEICEDYRHDHRWVLFSCLGCFCYCAMSFSFGHLLGFVCTSHFNLRLIMCLSLCFSSCPCVFSGLYDCLLLSNQIHLCLVWPLVHCVYIFLSLSSALWSVLSPGIPLSGISAPGPPPWTLWDPCCDPVQCTEPSGTHVQPPGWAPTTSGTHPMLCLRANPSQYAVDILWFPFPFPNTTLVYCCLLMLQSEVWWHWSLWCIRLIHPITSRLAQNPRGTK